MSTTVKHKKMSGIFILAGLFIFLLYLNTGIVNAKKAIDTGGMEITDGGVLKKYTDVHDKNHSITIPKEVTEIGDGAFRGCDKIKEVKFEKPNKIKSIGESAFSGCKALEEFTVPKNIYLLQGNTFNGCTKLKKVKLNGRLQSIGESCFAGCKSLKKIKFPDNLEYILDNAFSNCEKLGTIKFPDGLLYIGDSAFSGCTNLQTAKKNMPVCLIRLGNSAFQNCTKLKEMRFGVNLSTLSDNIGDIKDIGDLENIGSLGENCFSGCTGLKKVVFKNGKYKRGGKLVDSKNTQGIRRLGAEIFTNCKSLKEVVIEDYFIESIDDSIFEGCRGTIVIKAPKWVIEKSIKEFVERVKYNDLTIKYKAL